jgi:3-hydroxyisobutyrate dehydrogenase
MPSSRIGKRCPINPSEVSGMRIGFIGLGSLGRAIAERLMSQGIELVVWNRTREKAQSLGVPIAESPAELIEEVQRVIVIVFDSQASEEVIFGQRGLIRGSIKGKTVIDLTTNHFHYARLAYNRLKEEGAYYLDAPVLGSVIPARRGELTAVVGGDREVFEDNEELLRKFCRAVYYLGEAGRNGSDWW